VKSPPSFTNNERIESQLPPGTERRELRLEPAVRNLPYIDFKDLALIENAARPIKIPGELKREFVAISLAEKSSDNNWMSGDGTHRIPVNI